MIDSISQESGVDKNVCCNAILVISVYSNRNRFLWRYYTHDVFSKASQGITYTVFIYVFNGDDIMFNIMKGAREWN